MRVRNFLVLGFTALSVPLLTIDTNGQPAEKSQDLGAAKAAWQRRHETVRSLRVTLTEERTTHRGYYLQLPPRPGEKPIAPDEDVSVSFPATVSLKGNNFRYSYSTRRWSPLSRSLELVDYTAVSNPDVRIFLDTPTDSGRHPDAAQSNSRAMSDETVLSLVPLMLTVRSGQPQHRKLGDYTLTGKTVAIDGRICVELVRGSRTEGRTESLYLDRERDWVIRRIDGYDGDKLTLRINAEYVADPIVGWLPSRWSYVTRTPAGTPLSSGTLAAQHYEVNPEIPDAEFHPNYSPGTVVYDDTKGAGGETLSVVKADGSPGVAVPVALRPTLEQLEGANRSAGRQRVWLLVIGVAIIAIISMVAIRWYRHRPVGRGPAPADPSPQA